MWFRDAFCQEEDRQAQAKGISTYALLGQMAETVAPGSDKLIFLPWLSGERAPVLDHYARGGFVGLSLGHTKSHLARAVMEGVAFHIRWIIEALERLGLPIGEVNAIGGGSTSPVWTQIISDITGRRLRIVEHPLEAGAMGAALAVAVGLGIYPNMEAVDEVIKIHHTVEPRIQNQARYGALYQEYRAIYAALAPIYRRLHEVP